MNTKRWISISAALAAASFFTGCGGDNDNTTSASDSTLTKAEFISRADAICAKANKKDNAAGDRFFKNNPNPTDAQHVQFLNQHVIPGIQAEIDGVRALSPPSGDEEEVKAILDAAQQGLDEARQNPLVLTQEQGPPAFAKADKLAAAYGLKVCGGD